MVQVRPEGTRFRLKALSHAVTICPERSGRGPRLELPQISVANKTCSVKRIISINGRADSPAHSLLTVHSGFSDRTHSKEFCAARFLLHSCKHEFVILYRFSKHAGAGSVADLLGRDEQHPWFPAQSIEEAVKLSSMDLLVR